MRGNRAADLRRPVFADMGERMGRKGPGSLVGPMTGRAAYDKGPGPADKDRLLLAYCRRGSKWVREKSVALGQTIGRGAVWSKGDDITENIRSGRYDRTIKQKDIRRT